MSIPTDGVATALGHANTAAEVRPESIAPSLSSAADPTTDDEQGTEAGSNALGALPTRRAGIASSRASSNTTGVSSQRAVRALGVTGSRRGIISFASSGRSSGQSNERPTSATSNTHVPSLTSHAFFRPMSSQRLQAQRSQGPSSALGQHITSAPIVVDEKQEASKRYSNASFSTLRDGKTMQEEEAPPLPFSRGTESTEPEAERTVLERTRSHEDGSVAPLRKESIPERLTLPMNGDHGLSPPQKSPRSPRSLRSSLGLGGRNSKVGSQREGRLSGHEKLGSSAASLSDGMRKDGWNKQAERGGLGRNWQYYQGNIVFFLGGRLQNARSNPLNAATGLLAIVPTALFFGFSAPWLWHNISPALPILFAYVLFICMSSFFHASFSDPGILPRNLHPHPPPVNNDPLAIGPPLNEWVMIRQVQRKSWFSPIQNPNSSSQKTDESRALEVPVKYCTSCNIWRPPRGHHCRICGSCVETQDHHCIWLNICVGRRNYRYFFTFIASGTLLALMLAAFSLTHLLVWRSRQPDVTFRDAIRTWRVTFATFIYGALVSVYPVSLLGYHMFLTARGETTREYLNSHKFIKKDRHRPFDQSSWLKNWVTILARPRSVRYVPFEEVYVEGDQRFGSEKNAVLRRRKAEESREAGVEMKEVGSERRGRKKFWRGIAGPEYVANPQPTFQGPKGREAWPVNSTPR
ncbi:Eukaryotic peptide chain release factor GTP-binding subunit [Elasticomyces elasticus]|nr:Eukaryotic peptide chain release factor GTP-binding subunit [Elasticomyces elasticus]